VPKPKTQGKTQLFLLQNFQAAFSHDYENICWPAHDYENICWPALDYENICWPARSPVLVDPGALLSVC